MDSNCKIVINRLFGSKAVTVISKDFYVHKIESVVSGEDQRKVSFKDIIINNNTACTKAILKGQK